MIDGNPIDARRAYEIGLVNEIVETAQCVDAAITRAGEWASRPNVAVRAIKQQVNQATREQVSAEMLSSLDVSRAIFATADMREGVAAFVGKRKPRFEHR